MEEKTFLSVWLPRIQIALIFILMLLFILNNTFGS